MITPQTTLKLDSRVRFRRFEHEGIVINQKTSEALVLSEVGTRLLEMADGERNLQQCAAILSEEFDAEPEVIERDILRFATELVESGIAAAL